MTAPVSRRCRASAASEPLPAEDGIAKMNAAPNGTSTATARPPATSEPIVARRPGRAARRHQSTRKMASMSPVEARQ